MRVYELPAELPPIDALNHESVMQAVSRGIELLNQYYSYRSRGWRDSLDLTLLDAGSLDRDIIGQLFGGCQDGEEWTYWAGLLFDTDEPTDFQLVSHGFEIDTACPATNRADPRTRKRYALLTQCWLEALADH